MAADITIKGNPEKLIRQDDFAKLKEFLAVMVKKYGMSVEINNFFIDAT